MVTNKSKKKIEAIVKALISITIPLILLIASLIFLSETGNIKSNTEQDALMYNIIKYALYALDFVAIVLVFRTLFGLLYDLEILKKKQHKVNIKED